MIRGGGVLTTGHLKLHVNGDCVSVMFCPNPYHGSAWLLNPQLLVLRVACAQIAKMSGPAKALDELERGAEVTRVVAFGWSSTWLSLVSLCSHFWGLAMCRHDASPSFVARSFVQMYPTFSIRVRNRVERNR